MASIFWTSVDFAGPFVVEVHPGTDTPVTEPLPQEAGSEPETYSKASDAAQDDRDLFPQEAEKLKSILNHFPTSSAVERQPHKCPKCGVEFFNFVGCWNCDFRLPPFDKAAEHDAAIAAERKEHADARRQSRIGGIYRSWPTEIRRIGSRASHSGY